MPTLIDLFAGCGGMTAGFVRAGFTPVFAVEHDLHAAATYAANFGEHHVHWGDIAEVPDERIPRADVVIGGPPCQGFSNLGSKDVDDPRNQLWKQFLRFVQVARPQVFVIENVDRFRSSPEFALLLDEAAGGMIADYELAHAHLLAADYGVPQRRTRTIVIGSRIGPVDHPAPTRARGRWRTVRETIGALPARTATTALPDARTSVFGESVPGTFKWLDLHFGRTPTPLSLQRYAHIPPGGGRFDLPDELLPRCWREKRTGTTDVMGRMHWDQPSLTIRTEFFKPEKGRYLHPDQDRVVTHLEAALLQGFPEDFAWCGSKIRIARQIGNAVPVGLAAAIAGHVRERLR
ncbi:DNA cytosine methyltransferase [Pseudonocardia sp. WMMC193]|uniref:DNA cytosine methyltransferase n=1 Tax=Pseudonocardia sp. WMMC193 TaxID=2911965 RepID=UPI001F208F02|nr:DNA cytosine methyltransferase [Pseudonocardia sp. WMMC193]MCF7551530.1 DNA cytosine methyltransferase [Pseudonocardia sp. WMMC193]